MANFALYFPKENLLEGTKYENIAGDQPTKFGLIMDDLEQYYGETQTLSTLINLDSATAYKILKHLYWDFFLADEINNQSVADFIVDGGLVQGLPTIAESVQLIIGVNDDKMPGNKTLNAINSYNQQSLFDRLYGYRLHLFVESGKNKPQFYKGWINRLNAIKFA